MISGIRGNDCKPGDCEENNFQTNHRGKGGALDLQLPKMWHLRQLMMIVVTEVCGKTR